MILGIIFTKSQNGMLYAAAVFLGYSICSRRLIARDHRRGIRQVRNHQFEDAIYSFQKVTSFSRDILGSIAFERW